MNKTMSLVRKLDDCRAGAKNWKEFENICIEVLRHLFVPPLQPPKIQVRTLSGIERRDAIFPNRNSRDNGWGQIYRELRARLVLFEFKNYRIQIGKNEVIQTSSYLRKPMGRLAILCCNKLPNRSAHIKRNSIFDDEGKVILFLTKKHLKEMLYAKERGEDPAGLIIDEIEWFYIKHD